MWNNFIHIHRLRVILILHFRRRTNRAAKNIAYAPNVIWMVNSWSVRWLRLWYTYVYERREMHINNSRETSRWQTSWETGSDIRINLEKNCIRLWLRSCRLGQVHASGTADKMINFRVVCVCVWGGGRICWPFEGLSTSIITMTIELFTMVLLHIFDKPLHHIMPISYTQVQWN
jgi:hypothetical protein